MPRRRSAAITALVVWTLLVWTTRIRNIWGDDVLSNSEKWGRTALALSFTVLAGAVAAALWKPRDWLRPAVKVLAGWTIGVWAVRAVGIATGGHEASFIAVHLVLAVISWVLAALAMCATARVDSSDLAQPPYPVSRS